MILCQSGSARAAFTYPLTLNAEATARTEATVVTSRMTIRVDRLMEESRRKRVVDALTHGGYSGFLNALRALPPVGKIEVESRSVQIRYALEQQEGEGRKLVLVADRPLFFFGGRDKPRAGYELTLVELQFEAEGVVTGRMMGAARVKPSPAGVVVDDFAVAPVQLKARITK
jgi:hypothetical protein